MNFDQGSTDLRLKLNGGRYKIFSQIIKKLLNLKKRVPYNSINYENLRITRSEIFEEIKFQINLFQVSAQSIHVLYFYLMMDMVQQATHQLSRAKNHLFLFVQSQCPTPLNEHRQNIPTVIPFVLSTTPSNIFSRFNK